jgi:hypothetical protein
MNATRPTFTFDGFGINGPDEYRSRLATFTPAGHAYPNLGALLESAPDLLAELVRIVDSYAALIRDTDWVVTHGADIERARAVIAKAEAQS